MPSDVESGASLLGADPPRLSVVIPAFNAGRFLAATLESIRRQDVAGVEVIVADGGSTDDTVAIARASGLANLRILSGPDRGQLDALQKGIAAATGEVLFWLNGDDIVMPGAFDMVLAVLDARPDVDFVFSDDVAFDEDKRELYYGATIAGLGDWDHLLFYRQMYSECVYWRRRCTRLLPEAAYDLRVYTDYAFFLNLRWGRKGLWLRERLGAFRICAGQASVAHAARKQAEFHRIKDEHARRLGIGTGRVKAMRIAYRPWFFARQQVRPMINRGARKLLRLATRDRRRAAETRLFYDAWLLPSPPRPSR